MMYMGQSLLTGRVEDCVIRDAVRADTFDTPLMSRLNELNTAFSVKVRFCYRHYQHRMQRLQLLGRS